MDPASAPAPDLLEAVRQRYSQGASEPVAALCCPTDYDPALLAVIPEEVIARDYGCGNPARHLRPGETVLDLGSGTGKIAFIAAQVVGAQGRVIGVDMNADMLAVARRAAPVVAERLGFANVAFLEGRIEDLATDRAALARRLAERPVADPAGLAELERDLQRQRRDAPLVADASVDVVVSNCVLNLVLNESKQRLFEELFRVLRVGGRAVISDIVCDEPVPAALQRDPELWSGCIAGAFQEADFLHAFERSGFHGIEILERSEQPWQVVQGLEFRSLTVAAHKGKQGPCHEHHEAVIYKGPWRAVSDDDGHTLRRGERMAVCAKTFRLLTRAPYAGQILPVPARVPVPADDATPFACSGDRVRPPRETKGAGYDASFSSQGPGEGTCCEPGACC
jgi:SAM-dependent methyltransferase